MDTLVRIMDRKGDLATYEPLPGHYAFASFLS